MLSEVVKTQVLFGLSCNNFRTLNKLLRFNTECDVVGQS